MTEIPQRHPLGHPHGRKEHSCASCAWSSMRGPGPKVLRCIAAGIRPSPRVEPQWRCCEKWEAEPDCVQCNACCGPAYDVVEVGARDPARNAHPALIVQEEGRYRLRRRDSGRCIALQADGNCEIYSSRPACCRLFVKLGPNCIYARRRVGLSETWSMKPG